MPLYNTDHIGTYHLADDYSKYEIQRSNNFIFYVSGLNGVRNVTSLDGAPTYLNDAEDCLKVSVSQAFVPHFAQNVVEVQRGNNTLKYAGTPTFQGGTLAFNDYIGLRTKEALMSWQTLSYNIATEEVGNLAHTNYKLTGHLIEYAPDYSIVRSWTLFGCWISELSEDNYTAENGDKHSINCTIQYDYAKLDPPQTTNSAT